MKGQEMDEKLVTSRRQALGLASLAVAGVAVGAPAAAAAVSTGADPRRPSDAELERVARLYGGEFGGGRGAR
jgi:hypothetical protein